MNTTLVGASTEEGANLVQATELAPYSTIEEADIEQIARIIWTGWDDEWTDLAKEIHSAAALLYGLGYRKTNKE